jgi:hypothetical protein
MKNSIQKVLSFTLLFVILTSCIDEVVTPVQDEVKVHHTMRQSPAMIAQLRNQQVRFRR